MKYLVSAHTIAILLMVPQAHGELASLSDCELRGWDTSRAKQAHSLELVKEDSGCSARFEIRPEENRIHSGWRAEIKDPAPLIEGATVRYKFETYLPAELREAGTRRLVLAQWHDRKQPGQPAQRPPLTLRLHRGRLLFVLFNQAILDELGADSEGVTIASIPAVWNKWTQIEVRARWDANAGLIDIYANGRFIRRYKGSIGYATDRFAPYFKLGIYTVHAFKGPAYVRHRNVSRVVYDWGDGNARERGSRR